MIATKYISMRDFWFQECKKNLSQRYSIYQMPYFSRPMERIVLPAFEGRFVASVTSDDIEDLLHDLRRNQGRSDGNIAHTCIILRIFFRHAVAAGAIETNPMDSIRTTTRNPGIYQSLTQNELRTVRPFVNASPFRNIYRLIIFTGMQRKELLPLRCSDVNEERGIVCIPSVLCRNRISFTPSDSPEPHPPRRILPLSTQALAILQEQILLARERSVHAENPYLFLPEGEPGRQYQAIYSRLSNDMTNIRKRSGIRAFTCSALRNIFLFQAMQQGATEKWVQDYTGSARFPHICNAQYRKTTVPEAMQQYLERISDE